MSAVRLVLPALLAATVWMETVLNGDPEPDTEIFTFDVATGVERRVTMDALGQSFPDVSGDRIVWEEPGRHGAGHGRVRPRHIGEDPDHGRGG